VSPEEPPERVRPGVPVDVEYRYIPEPTVTVISDSPVRYPLRVDTFNDAFAVCEENVYDNGIRCDLP
jgi:hypothetical protein